MPFKVHPGIGVARIGNSPEFFIGPEVPDAVPAPSGGYRDSECRIKRQAALFRLFEHHADGTFTEVTAGGTTSISWSIRLRTGAAFVEREVTVSGAHVVASVPISAGIDAQVRTDAEGRLVLCSAEESTSLGAFPDTRSEGYVRATVTREGEAAVAADPSWVVIYPPDFAPALDPGSESAAETLLTLWPAAPPTAPSLPYTDQLDRGPLTFVGAWDAASRFSMLTAVDFAEPFRFVSSGPPSSLRHPSYPNWASDLHGLGTDTLSGCGYASWVSSVGVDGSGTTPTGLKGANWRYRGFVAEQSDGSVEYVDWCPVISAPALVNFHHVPRGSERAVPIHLELKNFPVVTTVTSTVVDQPSARLESDTWSTPVVGENHTTPQTIWAFFRAEDTTALGIHTGTIEFHVNDRHTVSIPLQAEVVEPTQVAIALVLDCSASMAQSRGDGVTRLQGLKDAVNVFVDVARPGNAIAVAPFSTTALPPLNAQILGGGDATDEAPGGARRRVRDFVATLATLDLTSIGAGMASGQASISTEAVADFAEKAQIVVTDGYETAPPRIGAVAATITTRMFAIGIGPAFEGALRAIAGERSGWVSILGTPLSAENRYALEKCFLQILAGATGDTIVDPQGELAPGDAHRIPFVVSDADLRLDVIVVSDDARALFVAVEGPHGELRSLEQLRAGGHARVTRTSRVAHVEMRVPFDADSTQRGWGAGTWSVVVAHGGQRPKPGPLHSVLSRVAYGGDVASAAPNGAISYLAMVNAATSLRLTPALRRVQDAVVLEAALSYGGAPVLRRPDVFANLTLPSGITSTIPLVETTPGTFRARVESSAPGRYLAEFRARGSSLRGHPFQRERVVEEFFADGQAGTGPALCDRCPGCERCRPLCALVTALLRTRRPLRTVLEKLCGHLPR